VLHDIAKKCKNFVATKEECVFKSQLSSSQVQPENSQILNALDNHFYDRKRLDLVIKHVPHEHLKRFLPASTPQPQAPLNPKLHPGVNVLLDVTLFSPSAMINNVLAADLDKRDAYFNIKIKEKENKYGDLSRAFGMTLVPIPMSVYGGIGENGAALIEYLIDNAVGNKVQSLAVADHLTARDMANHRSRLVNSYWRTLATAVQRVLVRNTINAYGGIPTPVPTSRKHLRSGTTSQH